MELFVLIPAKVINAHVQLNIMVSTVKPNWIIAELLLVKMVELAN